jgi:glycerate dehydrogenase
MDIFTDPAKNWEETEGKTIGIIGMGNIGSRVAKIAEAFGMKVCYFSTSGTGHCKQYPCLSLEELLKQSDIVSIHAPLNERTNGLIGAEELSMMKPTAILVNMGRGGIVDEKALADAISNNKIAGAALDVFTKEPLPADNPLLHVAYPESLRLAPHAAWASVQARERLVKQIADNIAAGW